jgi:hypothetical protein
VNTDKNLAGEKILDKNKFNKQLNIIPTPKEIESTSINKVIFNKETEYNIYLIFNQKGNLDFDLEKLKYAAIFLKEKAKERLGLNFKINDLDVVKLREQLIKNKIEKNSILIFLFNDRKESNSFINLLKSSNFITPVDLIFLNNVKIPEQSYILKIQNNLPTIILAISEMGCQYACSTLLQLFRKNNIKNSIRRSCPTGSHN